MCTFISRIVSMLSKMFDFIRREVPNSSINFVIKRNKKWQWWMLLRMLWYEQIFEFDFCQLWQGGELYLHEYFQKKISKNSKTSQFKPFLCLPSIGTYSYKGKFLHFGNAAPVAHKFIPEQFPSHEAHKIWCMMGSYLQIWIKSTFTIISQGPQNSHIYPF